MKNPVDYLLPHDDTADQVRWYRLRVAIVACAAFCLTVFGVVPALVTGLPIIGRVAWGQEVDTKIERAIAPIQQEVKEIKQSVEAINKTIAASTLTNLRNEMRETRRLYCRTRDASNFELARRYADDLQEQRDAYEIAAGRAWTMPACEDV